MGICFLAINRVMLSRRFTNLVLLAILTVITVALNGCGDRFIARKIESGVVARLPDIIGPAASYSVSVDGSAGKMMSGKISEMVIDGRDVRLESGLCVEQLVVRMRGVSFDAETRRFGGAQETTFEAFITEKSLTQLVSAKQPELKRLDIELSSGRMTVRTAPTVMGVSANVELSGTLEAGRENDISFLSQRMSVSGISVPGVVRDFVMKRINPVVTLPSIGFPATLAEVTILSNRIKVDGTADLAGGM